jgi:signal transduction histidine kinase
MHGHEFAKPMEQALERAEDMMIESRERLLDLRTPIAPKDLSAMLSARAAEAGLDGSTEIKMSVSGKRAPIDPSVAEEITAIVSEALINVRRHAEAKNIEVSIIYNRWRLDVAVRDDGKGIDPQVMRVGRREGHFGLVGMRERAKRIHSRLEIHSDAANGTGIRIVVPAYVAYQTGWFGRFWSKSAANSGSTSS